MPLIRRPRGRGGHLKGHHSDEEDSTPICRCRVLYLGSAVPHITKDGLQGIQEPLKELYPDTGLSSLKGIDSWLSVWSNGLLLENVDEKNTKISRFFPIESLHYCAAVRNVLVPATNESPSNEKTQRFLPLDSPFARLPNLNHPPLFACILRRTTGIKVLECHAFICKREMAANALVRCCFHAYADSTYAKQLENGTNANSNGNGGGGNGTLFKDPDRQIQRSITPLNSIEKVAGWQALSQQNGAGGGASTDEDCMDAPVTSTPRTGGRNKCEFYSELEEDDEIYEEDENHKIWGANISNGSNLGTSASELVYLESDGTLKSIKSHNSRLSKPRQFISPPPPPPPPPSVPQPYMDPDACSAKGKRMKKKMKKDLGMGGCHTLMQGPTTYHLMRPASMLNLSGRAGSVLNMPVNRPGSAMSTLTRSRPQLVPLTQLHHQYGHHHLHNMLPQPHMLPPQPLYGHFGYPPPPHMPHPGAKGKKDKSKNKQYKHMLTPVPLLAPIPMHPMMHPGVGPTPPPSYNNQQHHFGGRDDAGSSMANYATIERGYHYHRSSNRLMGVMPNSGGGDATNLQPSRGRPKEPQENGGSPFNTGIYRKKGHLNERAFSYSIRQEHRSRSHGSLANLHFAENGGEIASEGISKDREIIQMVRDMDLSGDEIERSQVPSEMYPPKALNGCRRPQNGVNLNHRGPRITHR